MRNRIVMLGTGLVAGLVMATIGSAGGHATGHCGGTAAGTAWACGDGGCGPRYWGPWHGPCDPCDACGRWVGCNGPREGDERLAPWQLPPGCGFTKPAHLGYTRSVGPCEQEGCKACQSCRPCHARCWLCPLNWF